MVNTLWSDISEFQVQVNDTYPYRFLSLRSNDGSYEDHHFTQNIAWCRAAIHAGRIWGFMVYYFYRPGFNGAQLLMSRVGKPDPRLTVMIDVEGANGQVSGNQSGAINAQFNELAHWIGSPKRVVGYGNPSDLNGLWPQKPPGIRLVVADYGANPPYPGKFAHQYTDAANTNPFGPSDLNSADGMSAVQLEAMFGFTAPRPAPPPPVPPPPPATGPFRHVTDGTHTLSGIATSRGGTTVQHIMEYSGQHYTAADYDAIGALKLPAGYVYYTANP
jgi:hypothetical protein